ncbi:MAG: hypothetical protein DVB28_000155 [Verrucomicrobia bacterium]|nr:MAG: hypothetical protein DVB28_000155 [Verrucomicrobiota bacterium]
MKHTLALLTTLLLAPLAALQAADIELTETVQLPECHSVNWVRDWVKDHPELVGAGWEQLHDASRPAAEKPAPRSWVWNISEAQWTEAVKQKGEGKREEVKLQLWLPSGVEVIRGVVAVSGHGSGEALYRHPALRKLAGELHLAIFKFNGNPMQRGFWPTSLLYQQLKDFGVKTNHPELEHAPLFLYGHSSAVGFSALFAAEQSDRIWGWVAMRAGYTFQIYQPGAAKAPGLVMFGEEDKFFANDHRAETLALVPMMRKHHNAAWNLVVEPKTGHGPSEKTWPLVFSFLRHTFEARIPAAADARKGPVKLNTLAMENGHLGQNWDAAKGGYQNLSTKPFATFVGDKATASWLINAAYAADWLAFQRDGEVRNSK